MTSVTNQSNTIGNDHLVYSFPLLKPSMIYHTIINEMKINVKEEAIRQCDSEAIRIIFEAFIASIMKITNEDMKQMALERLSAMNYPELHEESIIVIDFYHTVVELMEMSGINDFSLRDIAELTPKRVRRQLSALINLGKFGEERAYVFRDYDLEAEQLDADSLAYQDDVANLEQELQELIELQEQEAPAIAEIQEEIQELDAQNNILNRRQATLRQENVELKAQNNALKDDLATLQFNKLEADKELERWHGKLVSSPDRLQKEMDDLAVYLEDKKEELKVMELRRPELRAITDVFVRTKKDFARIFELLDEAANDVEGCRQAKQDVRDLIKETEESRRTIIELIARRKRNEILCEQKQAQYDQAIEEARIRDEVANERLKKLTETLNQLERTQGETRDRIAEYRATCRELNQKVREEELEFEKDIHAVQQRLTTFFMAADHYVNQLLHVVESDK